MQPKKKNLQADVTLLTILLLDATPFFARLDLVPARKRPFFDEHEHENEHEHEHEQEAKAKSFSFVGHRSENEFRGR